MIGQDSVVTVLKAFIIRKHFGSAYMFSGPAGTGKTTLGRIFAMAILCDSPKDGNPCLECESCKLFMKEQHFGYREMDAASVGGKEDMIKLRDDAAFSSISKKKIILLDECHDISKAGQDALLKQTEQCPDHLVYIFCTTDPDKMGEPLRTRCKEFQITKVDPILVLPRLKFICDKEGITYDEPALISIAEKSNGHVRNAIKMLEEVMYIGPVTIDNINTVSKNYDEDILNILINLGTNLSAAYEAYHNISSYLSPLDLYGKILELVNDSCRFLYGYDNFLPNRLKAVTKMKDVHGTCVLEFLNYLITRDKFVDRIGLLSDIIVLHYKFSAKNFAPVQSQVQVSQTSITPQVSVQATQNSSQKPQPSAESSSQVISFAQLQKMSIKDKSKALRESYESRRTKKEQSEEARVPSEWPLPKDERPGEKSDNEELSPQEFSRNLVGGRGSGII